MSTDLVLRTITTLACVYTFGFLVTVMSLASLEAAGLASAALPCGPGECHTIATTDRGPAPQDTSSAFLGAAVFLARQ